MVAKLLIVLLVLAAARMFRWCTRSSYYGSASLFVLCAVCVADREPEFLDAATVLAVVLLWPLIEAAYHKHVMHSRRFGTLVFTNHAIHHASPTVLNGLMPLYHVLQLAGGYWVLRDRPVIAAVLTAVVVMLCAYEVVHAAVHAGWAPRALAGHHLRHHSHPRENFTVTSRLG